MMNIAIIGGGGREHALAQKIKQSPLCQKLYALPGNGGIGQIATCVDISGEDIPSVVAFCKGEKINYVVVAPDAPLALGMVDALATAGIPAFGPTKAAAQLEASKTYAKNFMRRHHIPTAAYAVFTQKADALAHILRPGGLPAVIKAVGLALGKGVFICHTPQQAKDALHTILEAKAFGESGRQVVIEEFLQGPEVSVLAFCDGERLVPMVSSMDHKRLLDGDKGPNTGGMGAIAPNPFYTNTIAAYCMQHIFMPTVQALQQEGTPFKGCLYFGLMLTQSGPKVIEYNCRFGDPETQAVLPLLKSDLLPILLACTKGNLTPGLVEFSSESCACVVVASGAYPTPSSPTYPPVTNLPKTSNTKIHLYHSGTKLSGEELLATGGRVFSVSATAPNLHTALQKAYTAVEKIHFDGCRFRQDIGAQALQWECLRACQQFVENNSLPSKTAST